MKLTHFAQPSPEASRLRSIGRALVDPVAEPAAVAEAKKQEPQVSDDDTMKHQKRQFALQQLEAADNHHYRHMARKIKNFD